MLESLGAWIVLALGIGLGVAALGTLIESRQKRGHNPQDPLCKFYTGDRAGFNMFAMCNKCKGVTS